MKKNLLKAMLVAMGMVTVSTSAWADGSFDATVKMTWVDKNNPDATHAGETPARAGYNKIAGGAVAFANEGWKENKVILLQVDASGAPGYVKTASLSCEVSGSTDSKRTTGWGVGFNSSVWEENLTFNTADLSITTMGGLQWTSTKSSGTFEQKTFDITKAFSGDEDKIVTILVYETAAAGGYFQNPTVTVTWTDQPQAPFTFKFVDADGNDIQESYQGFGGVGDTPMLSDKEYNDISAGGILYNYVSDNAAEQTIAEDGSTVVTITFAEAPKFHYELQFGGMGTPVSGEGYANTKVTVGYPKYYFYSRGSVKVLYEAPQNPTGDGYYQYGIQLDTDPTYAELAYNTEKTAYEGVVYYAEAENIEGMTSTSNGNANIRCSNAAGGYNATEGNVTVTTLGPGNYVLTVMTWGNTTSNEPMKIVVGENELACTTMGYLQQYEMEFKLTGSTPVEITPGGDSNGRTIDYIIIREVPETINWTVKGSEGTTIFAGGSYQGVAKAIAVPKFIWNQEAQSLSMTANNGDAGWYQHTFIPETEGQEFEVTYEAGPQGVVLYAEAEDVEGMSKATGSNANIRCSQGAGGFNNSESEVLVGTVPESGEYVVVFAVWGGADTEMTVNAGGNPFTITTTGSLTEQTSEPMSLSAGATITIPVCGNSSHVIDYVYVQKADYATAIKGVKQVSTDDNAIYNLAGQQVKSAQKGIFIQNGKKVVK